jgi:hypothetical protein
VKSASERPRASVFARLCQFIDAQTLVRRGSYVAFSRQDAETPKSGALVAMKRRIAR